MINTDSQLVGPEGVVPGLVEPVGHREQLPLHRRVVALGRVGEAAAEHAHLPAADTAPRVNLGTRTILL